jgi:aldehyde dehydrogenase (NAD+)
LTLAVNNVSTNKTEADAIEIANDTEFGLIAYVSSADPERACRVARKLAAGRVLINTVSTAIRENPRRPHL